MKEARETDGSGQPANEKKGSFVIAGKYEVLEEVAAGGGGTAYKVRQALLGSTLSVTVLPASPAVDPGQAERLRDAVQQASRLRHDNIARVIDFGQEAGRWHVVEAFADGMPVDRILRGGNPLGSTEALHVAHQLADALAYAHESGVVHGGISPAGVRVRRTNPPRATLCGFAAAASDPVPSAALVPYSAPERLAGQPADVRADIFALGLLIYEMFEGKRFLSGGESEIRSFLLEGTGPLLPRFSRIAPAGVPALVARAIRRKPVERQQSMAQVRSEIEACLMRLGEIDFDVEGAPPDDAPVRRRVSIGVDDAPLDDEIADRVSRIEPVRAVVAHPRARASTGVPLPFSIARVLMVAAAGLALAWPFLRERQSEPSAPAPVPASVAPEQPPAPSVEAPLPPTAMPEVEPEPSEDEPVAVASEGPAPPPPEEVARPEAAAGVAPPARPRQMPAPRIVSYWPGRHDAVSVIEGGAVDFGVRVAVRGEGDRLTYAWSLDGRRVGRKRGWRFVAPPPVSTTPHMVAVLVSSRAGEQASLVSWQVEVTPRMSDVDVRDWLERLASALERKDVPTLRLYGIVTSEAEAEVIREQLPRAPYRVGIANETISTSGKYATVTFDRALLDPRGKALSTRRESYELEKHAGGFVALRDH